METTVIEGRFEGKVALVTGAASGVGRATAQRLAAEGATVWGIDVDGDGLAGTADGEDRIRTRVADISSQAACQAAVAACVEADGRLDVVANVAGVLRSGHLADLTEADLGLMWGVNVAGMLWMCQASIPHLVQTDGAIINIASNAGLMGVAYHAGYAATKGAVVNLTRSLAMEFIRTGVRINCVAPGGVKTPMSRGAQLPEDVDWDLVKPYMGFRAMSRPEEIAEVIVFLASPAAVAVHGAVLSADTGITTG